MIFGLSPAELGTLALALCFAGLVTGFMAGLLGIGGGGILVPVLYETFAALGVDPSIRMHLSLGTALLVIIPTGLRSFLSHNAKGAVDWEFLRRTGPWVVGGVICGVLVAKGVNSAVLKWVWVVAGLALAAKMVFGRDDWRLGTELPKSKLVEIAAAIIGLISTLMSIGGAAYFVTMMVLYGRPLIQAVATSAGFGPIIAIPGALGFAAAGWGEPGLPPLSLGFVNILGALLIIPASVFAAPLGVRVAHGIPKRTLELCFAAFLTLVAMRFLYSLLTS